MRRSSPLQKYTVFDVSATSALMLSFHLILCLDFIVPKFYHSSVAKFILCIETFIYVQACHTKEEYEEYGASICRTNPVFKGMYWFRYRFWLDHLLAIRDSNWNSLSIPPPTCSVILLPEFSRYHLYACAARGGVKYSYSVKFVREMGFSFCNDYFFRWQ